MCHSDKKNQQQQNIFKVKSEWFFIYLITYIYIQHVNNWNDVCAGFELYSTVKIRLFSLKQKIFHSNNKKYKSWNQTNK